MESLRQVHKLLSKTVKRSILYRLHGRIFSRYSVFSKPTFTCDGIDWVHSQGSGIDHSSKTTKKYWCSNSRGGFIIVITGKLPTRTASCRALLHSRTILLRLFRQLARADMCVPATSVLAENEFSRWQDLLWTQNGPREWIKLFYSRQQSFCYRLIHVAFVTWRSSGSVLTWENKFNSHSVPLR